MGPIAWDPQKNEANQAKHGLSFEEASVLFASGVDYLEVFDEAHSEGEDRFIAIGPVQRGVVAIVWTELDDGAIRIISARHATRRERTYFERHLKNQR